MANSNSGRQNVYSAAIYFQLGIPHRGLIARVVREAVLDVIGNPLKSYDAAALAVRVRGILQRYRATLGGMIEAGHLDTRRALKLGNCRPAGFHATPHLRPCDVAAFCPWCWGRRAAEHWLRVQASLFPLSSVRKRGERAAVDLVLTTRWLSVAQVADYIPHGHLACLIDERLIRNQSRPGPGYLGSRRCEMDRLRRQFLWGIEGLVLSVAYGRAGDAQGWRAGVRQLFAVPAGGEFAMRPPEWGDDGTVAIRIERIATPNRTQAARAVARLFRYPRGLLGVGRRRGHAGALARYLDAVAGRKLWSAYGLPTVASRAGGGAEELPNVRNL